MNKPREAKDLLEANKHLALAQSYVNDAWFPVDNVLLERVQNNFRKGVYDNDRPGLIRDLKQDCSLFLFCLKRLSESADPKISRSPMKLFEGSSIGQLRDILNVPAHSISTYSAEETRREHLLRLEYAVASATTAEALSPSSSIEGLDAFSCGLLRQLGLTLIAWNYPHVYNRVVQTLSPDQSLDDALNRMLGFSPRLLAIGIARSWGLGPELVLGLGDVSAQSENSAADQSIESLGNALQKLCQVSEAFAECWRDEAPQQTKPNWKAALSEIEKNLGPQGVEVLRGRIREGLKNYAQNHPEISNWVAAKTSVEASHTETKSQHSQQPRVLPAQLLAKNLYINRCPPEVRTHFESLYQSLQPGSISKQSVEILRSMIVPMLGFNRGCIYLFDPEGLVLIPRLPLGPTGLKDFKPVKYATSEAAFDPVVAAFSSKTPTLEEQLTLEGEKISFIAGSIGELVRAGVLYLEIDKAILEKRGNNETNPLVAFKAIRQALSDSLDLK